MERDRRKKDHTDYLPVCLDVRRRKCLVVGGGKVAERKISVLIKFGADITCMSPAFTAGIDRLRKAKKILCVNKGYPKSSSLKKYILAVAATDDPAVNKRVWLDAGRDRVLVNVIDKSAPGTVIMPAILKRKGLVIGVSTGGKSPALSKRIRNIIKDAL